MKLESLQADGAKGWLALAKQPLASALWSPLSNQYYCAYYGYDFNDHSVAVVHGDEAVAWLLVSRSSVALGYYGASARMLVVAGLDKHRHIQAVALMTRYLQQLHQQFPTLAIQYQQLAAQPDTITSWLLEQGAVVDTRWLLVLPLSDGRDGRWADLRKAMRQGVRWGEQQLEITVWQQENLTPDVIERFRQFHIEVAGRETRSHASWLAQEAMVAAGEAEIIESRLDDELVGMSLFQYGAACGYYSVGVYARHHFDKPVSHLPVWRGIERAIERGLANLEMGDIPFPGQTSDAKAVAIGRFKRGFGGELRPVLQLTLNGNG